MKNNAHSPAVMSSAIDHTPEVMYRVDMPLAMSGYTSIVFSYVLSPATFAPATFCCCFVGPSSSSLRLRARSHQNEVWREKRSGRT